MSSEEKSDSAESLAPSRIGDGDNETNVETVHERSSATVQEDGYRLDFEEIAAAVHKRVQDLSQGVDARKGWWINKTDGDEMFRNSNEQTLKLAVDRTKRILTDITQDTRMNVKIGRTNSKSMVTNLWPRYRREGYHGVIVLIKTDGKDKIKNCDEIEAHVIREMNKCSSNEQFNWELDNKDGDDLHHKGNVPRNIEQIRYGFVYIAFKVKDLGSVESDSVRISHDLQLRPASTFKFDVLWTMFSFAFMASVAVSVLVTPVLFLWVICAGLTALVFCLLPGFLALVALFCCHVFLPDMLFKEEQVRKRTDKIRDWCKDGWNFLRLQLSRLLGFLSKVI